MNLASDDGAVEVLTEMVRVPSLCGEEDGVATLLLSVMEEAGFETERDVVGNVLGTIGNGPGSVVLLGHMDTVPGAIPVQIRDGKLYGRGAVDAKGPLAGAVVAAARAAGQATARITVIGGVQEEGPSTGARHLAQREPPDFLVIAEPSGWDAVVLGYKGSRRFTVEVRQPSSHSAGPEPTAAERVVAFWNDLTAWCDRQAEARSGEFNRLTATLIDMASKNDGLCDTASMQIGLRLPPGLSPDLVQDDVRALLPEGSFVFSPGEPAVRGEKSSPLIAAFLRSIRTEGGTPRFKLKTGTSDMNVVGPVWGCPMAAYGPGDSRLDHTPREHLPIEDYLRGVRVLTRVLEEL